MAVKRMVLELGMGTDIRGADYTKAAVRALRDALWHNSLSIADAVGLPTDSMQVEVRIGALVDGIEEVDPLLMSMSFHAFRDHESPGDVGAASEFT